MGGEGRGGEGECPYLLKLEEKGEQIKSTAYFRVNLNPERVRNVFWNQYSSLGRILWGQNWNFGFVRI